METKSRKMLMSELAAEAKRQYQRGDIARAAQLSTTWSELATDAELSRAPQYLRWTGRRN